MPLPDKVEAIKNIVIPTTKKQLRRFIGLSNKDVWQHWSKIITLRLLNKPNGIVVKKIRRHFI